MLDKIIDKLKLTDNFSLSLPIDKVEFYQKLHAITKEASGPAVFQWPSLSYHDPHIYIGKVSYDYFEIERRLDFFNTDINHAIALGTITPSHSSIKIDTVIKGSSKMVFGLIIICMIYILGLCVLIVNVKSGLLIALFLLLHGFLMIFIFYKMMRNSVRNLKYWLEREFYFFTKPQ